MKNWGNIARLWMDNVHSACLDNDVNSSDTYEDANACFKMADDIKCQLNPDREMLKKHKKRKVSIFGKY